MRALIVISKFMPEYSGPGVRLPRLYDFLKKQFTFESLDVLTSGTELTDHADYSYGHFSVHRRASPLLKKHTSLSNIIPQRITNIAVHWDEIRRGMSFFKKLNYRPDYLHILGGSGITAAGLAWANQHKVPVLMELVTAKAAPSQRFYGTMRASPPANSTLIAMTRAAARRCAQEGFEKNTWLRPNPIDEDVFQPAFDHRPALRQSLTPFNTNDVVITSVAKIIPQKNQIFLLDVLRLLPERYKLIIAGPLVQSGPLIQRDQAYMKAIKQKIQDFDLGGRVHMVTDYVEADLYMKASDIYALPAHDEGFGTPMLEAMACGLPVIANKDEASFREWVVDGINGYACPLNPEIWAPAIEKAAALPPEQKLEAAEFVRHKAGQKRIYHGYADVIKNLVSNISGRH